jgi:hypothetical protein
MPDQNNGNFDFVRQNEDNAGLIKDVGDNAPCLSFYEFSELEAEYRPATCDDRGTDI